MVLGSQDLLEIGYHVVTTILFPRPAIARTYSNLGRQSP
jgi:hypothetical protein